MKIKDQNVIVKGRGIAVAVGTVRKNGRTMVVLEDGTQVSADKVWLA